MLRNNGASGQLLGSWTRMRAMCSITRTNLDQALSGGRELGAGERAPPRDRGAHSVHQPERSSMQNEPHLIGGRAVARHAIRRLLGEADNSILRFG
jgi:hypothetical protein